MKAVDVDGGKSVQIKATPLSSRIKQAWRIKPQSLYQVCFSVRSLENSAVLFTLID